MAGGFTCAPRPLLEPALFRHVIDHAPLLGSWTLLPDLAFTMVAGRRQVDRTAEPARERIERGPWARDHRGPAPRDGAVPNTPPAQQISVFIAGKSRSAGPAIDVDSEIPLRHTTVDPDTPADGLERRLPAKGRPRTVRSRDRGRAERTDGISIAPMRMHGMAENGRGNRLGVYAFAALACALSWTLWILVIASDRGWISVYVPVNPWGSFGPALAAIVLVARANGSKGVTALLRPLLWWRFGFLWWLVSLGLPVALVALSLIVFRAPGNEIAIAQGFSWGGLVILLPVILVIGGPLGEEIGWRGFALPSLLERHGPIVSSLIVAVIWMVWHFPLFWLPGAAQQGSSIAAFFAMVAGISVLATWIYLGTRRSLLAVLLFHFSINATTFSVSQAAPDVDSATLYQRALLVVIWLAALGAALGLRRRDRGKH
jgi:membrane protease YdiL (CAAX protease family)